MTWRQFKRIVDQMVIEDGGDPNLIEINHIDFGREARPGSIRVYLGEKKDRLQIWDNGARTQSRGE